METEKHTPLVELTSELGPPIATYGKSNTGCVSVTIVIMGVVGIGFLVLGVAMAGQGVVVLLPFLVVGLALLCLSIRGLTRNFGTQAQRVSVFSDGLVTRTEKGGDTVLRWDDVASVWQSVTSWQRYGTEVTRSYRYTIQLKDDRKFEFYNLENIQALGQTIQQQVTRRRLPAAVEKLVKGEGVSLGPLSVSAEGLSRGGGTIPWGQIRNVEVDKGYLYVYQRDGARWLSIEVPKVPNVFVLLALIDHFRGRSR